MSMYTGYGHTKGIYDKVCKTTKGITGATLSEPKRLCMINHAASKNDKNEYLTNAIPL